MLWTIWRFCWVYFMLALMWAGAEVIFEGAIHSSWVDGVINGYLALAVMSKMEG